MVLSLKGVDPVVDCGGAYRGFEPFPSGLFVKLG